MDSIKVMIMGCLFIYMGDEILSNPSSPFFKLAGMIALVVGFVVVLLGFGWDEDKGKKDKDEIQN